MPTPLQLNDDEMSVLMSLAGPIDQQRRPQFLQEVAQELEVKRQGRRDRRGVGASAWAPFRGNIGSRRRFRPTRRRPCIAAAPPKGRILKLENYG